MKKQEKTIKTTSVANRRVPAKSSWLFCLAAGKDNLCYKSESAARIAAVNYYAHYGKMCHDYFCHTCDAWHLGSGSDWRVHEFNQQINHALQSLAN